MNTDDLARPTMRSLTARLEAAYFGLTVGRPLLALMVAVLLVAALAPRATEFRVDASADSLVLQGDEALRYYRSVNARYGGVGGSVLIVIYTRAQPLFSQEGLAAVDRLRGDLARVPGVASVTSMVDVPLLDSAPQTLTPLRNDPPTVLSPGIDLEQARHELTHGELYGDLVVGSEGKTTALYVRFREDPQLQQAERARDALLEARLERRLTAGERARLAQLSRAVREHAAGETDRLRERIGVVRNVVARHENGATIDLAGTSLIVADMIRFVWRDLRVFGAAVLAFIVVQLAVVFRRVRWVAIPVAICAGTGVGMIGLLGWTGWRVTVVSSNFLSVLLVVTLALVVHLIVRYQELSEREPGQGPAALVTATIRSKFAPSCYTALTTMVAFASLAVSDVQPVIDFGLMMVIGIVLAFALTFLVFPASLALLKPIAPPRRRFDMGGRVTAVLAALTARRERSTVAAAAALAALGIAGAAQLSVDNRFIDYFDESTEIYQGMLTLDRALGGTTPFDVVLDADPQYLARLEQRRTGGGGGDSAAHDSGGFPATSYWFDMFRIDAIERVHEYLQSLPETGKVQSLATAFDLLRRFNHGLPLDNFTLAIAYKRMPERVKDILIDPYLSADGQQIRFSVRVYESDPTLDRSALLDRIRADLTTRLGLQPQQVHLTGLMVLYNNVLQSLFRSQALTLGFVFGATGMMFAVLFRSIRLALLALVPNLLVALLVLGAMGGLGISLDIMTITIAAIVLGIAVDDSIHYVHRWQHELQADGDARAAVRRAHASVGRAMLYTSVTIALGASLFALSAFNPIAYFGMLTGLAMVAALLANLTLLPALLVLAGRRPAHRSDDASAGDASRRPV